MNLRRRAWPGSHWLTARRSGVFLLRPRRARLSLVLWVLVATAACFVVGGVVFAVNNTANVAHLDQAQKVIGVVGATIILAGPPISAVAFAIRIRRKTVVSASAGLWFRSGRSVLHVAWEEIAGVVVAPAARHQGVDVPIDHASRWYPAVTTHAGQQFVLTRLGTRARGGPPRQRSRCGFGVENVAAMVAFATGSQMVPGHGESPDPVRRRSWERRRTLPDDATVAPRPAIVGRLAARLVFVPVLGGVILGIVISALQKPSIGAGMAAVTVLASIMAMVLLFGASVWLTYWEFAWGGGWLAWRRRSVGRWRIIPLANITRISFVGDNPISWKASPTHLLAAVRTDDGRTRKIRLTELVENGKPLRDRITELVEGPLTPVSTDRAREILSAGSMWSKLDSAHLGTLGSAGLLQSPPFGGSPYGRSLLRPRPNEPTPYAGTPLQPARYGPVPLGRTSLRPSSFEPSGNHPGAGAFPGPPSPSRGGVTPSPAADGCPAPNCPPPSGHTE